MLRDAWMCSMPVGPISAIFLILSAASTAVVVSMIVVALFDRAFVKKKPPTAIKKESHEPGSPNRMTNMGSLKPKPSAVPKHYTKAQQQAGCSPETQRVRTFG
jgi:hypothetical protein